MFIVVLFLGLLFRSVLCQQGVFHPATFQQSACSGTYKWTMWFDTNDPTAVQGDGEVTSHIQKLFPTFICDSPIAIEAQTSFDTSPTTTGDVFRLTVKEGFLCVNQQIASFKNRICNDYKVRYCCPATSISK